MASPTDISTRNAVITIATDDNLSAAVPTGGGKLCGILMPAGFDAGNLTFEASVDGSTFGVVADSAGNVVTITAPAVNEFIALDPTIYQGILSIKVGTSAAQTSNRTFVLVFRE